MSDLASTIDDLLASPPVTADAPMDELTGISASRAGGYADPEATPRSYYGDGEVVETVGELLCSSATVRAAPSQYRFPAAHDLLATPFAPADVADYCGPYVSDSFDPGAVTAEDLALRRLVACFGASVNFHGHHAELPTIEDVSTDDCRVAFYAQQVALWRPAFDHDLDLTGFETPRAVSGRLEMSRSDATLFTTAADVATLADADARAAATTTRVAADLVVAASLLFRTNFARRENLDRVRICAGRDAVDGAVTRGSEGDGVTFVVHPPDCDLTLAVCDRGESGDALIGRLVTEQVASAQSD